MKLKLDTWSYVSDRWDGVFFFFFLVQVPPKQVGTNNEFCCRGSKSKLGRSSVVRLLALEGTMIYTGPTTTPHPNPLQRSLLHLQSAVITVLRSYHHSVMLRPMTQHPHSRA